MKPTNNTNFNFRYLSRIANFFFFFFLMKRIIKLIKIKKQATFTE